jgi:predicted negative regulator of RcsB-dependent stress response
VDAYRTEDEQVEALKRWWKENGTSTLLTILVVVGGYFGWQAWDKRQLQQAALASGNYQQLLQVAMEIEQEPSESRYATASHLSESLKTDFADTDYARFAALMQAKLLVDRDDLDAAEAQLRWLLASDPEPSLRQLANLRLARVLFAANKAEQALALIEAVEHGQLAAEFLELRGDIHYNQGDIDIARQDYQNALQGSSTATGAAPLLKMKVESLPGGAADDGGVMADES